jgi:GMP synthase (glutamine-hydrolysing)
MPSAFDDLRVLLVQVRNTADMEAQEQACFLERCRVRPAQLKPHNVVRAPLSSDVLDGVDAVMIGGAGEYSVTQDPPWMDNLLSFVRGLRERRVPTFGSCYGHQLMARAFGGTVVHDPERAEIGGGSVMLTEHARYDPLFSTYPDRFRVNMGHHDRVSVLPSGAVELAYNASQRNQAFRMADAPMYGTQFHTELSPDRVRERLVAYRGHYDEVHTDEAMDQVLASLDETTEADFLLHDFLVRVVIDRS